MYRNRSEVQEFLERGGTLVVPTRQRAAAVRLAYTAELLSRGARTWSSPDVLHWNAWHSRRFDLTRGPGARAARRLAAVEEWFLWRDALEQPDAAHGLLQPHGLLEHLQQAEALIEAWGLPEAASPGSEGNLLDRLRRHVAQRRRQLRVGDRNAWREGVSADPTRAAPNPAEGIWCLGFDEVGRADRRALESLGVRMGGVRRHDAAPVTPRVVAARDPDSEARLVADWCRAHLQRDGRARLLVMAPRLSLYEIPLRAALTERLDGDAIGLRIDAAPSFAIEGGSPLLQCPLIAAAHAWLRAVCGVLEFEDYSPLLRSAYLRAGGIEARTRLELWLRRRQVTALDAGRLPRLLAFASRELDADAAGVLDLLQQLQRGDLSPAPPDTWAQRWVQWLRTAGWPGEFALGTREQQVRQRFELLLGEIAQLGDVAGPCGADRALALLDGWLRRAHYEPASGDIPVSVSGDLSDPLLEYDGIWVCGLSAQDWPPAAAVNPFVSRAGLQAAGSDAGSAAGTLRRAEEAMRAWAASTSDLVCSWPRQSGDALLMPSPLLAAAGEGAGAGMQLPGPSPWCGVHVGLEPYGLQPPRPWPAGRAARGGVGLLQQQSLCPFQGFALGRLQSARLELPQPGLSVQAHGIVLHEALRQIWSELGDSATLHRRQPELDALVRRAVRQALEQARAASAMELPAALWEVEARRCEHLIQGLLRVELQREPFTVIATEQRLALQSQGMALGLVIDRLDRIADGRTVLLDYKSGRLRSFDPLSPRPDNPQLLAYASALPDGLCAVATAHLNVAGCGWQGAADTAARLPRVRAAGDGPGGWPALLRRWRAQVDGLLAEFAAGEARVAPLPKACERCHLGGLCRIAENGIALNELAGDDAPAARGDPAS